MLKDIFKNNRIIGLAGAKSSGKTNNLIYLMTETKRNNKNINIFFYGMNRVTADYLELKGMKEINSLSELTFIRNSIIVLDECQKLKLNDRRNKDLLDALIDFIYHNNNYLILSSPNIRDFTKNISSKIESWMLKKYKSKDCLRGSELIGILTDYKGKYKGWDALDIPQDTIILYDNGQYTHIENIKYIQKIDNKALLKNIFEV